MQFTLRASALAFTLVSVITPSFAQTSIKLENFSERFNKDVPVSGRILVGAAILPERMNLKSWLRWAPSTSKSDTVCVTYATRNGVYAAQGRVAVQAITTHKGPWQIEGDHHQDAKTILNILQPTDLAILARQGQCDQSLASKGEPIILIDRRDKVSDGGVVALLINPLPGRSVAVDAEYKGSLLTTKCVQLSDEQRSKAYAMQCEFNLPADAGEIRLRVERRRFEQIHESNYTLVWGSR